MRLSCLEAPPPPDRGDVSGLSTRFSTTNKALRSVKETKGHAESHDNITRQCGQSPVTMSAVLHCVYLAWRHPRCRIEVTFQISRPRFSPSNTALSAVKETEECDKSHVDLALHYVKSPSNNERSSPLRLSCLETPALPDRGDILGLSTRFSTTNTAFRAVKETE